MAFNGIHCRDLEAVCAVTGNETLTSASASAERGVSSAGFTTTVQPAARAAATFLVIMALGKFH